LQNERRLKDVIDDDTTLNRLSETAEFLQEIGLIRYEISNYAIPGYECRHNLAVWRGEDYFGIGDGACGRIGRRRTRNFWGLSTTVRGGLATSEETVSEEFDEKERRLFRLRTIEGLDASGHPEWEETLERFVSEGLLTRAGDIYRLSARGTEVCDSILSELA
jgi:oxygen-independent coproporphyrinogen-3 oxidase